MSLWGQHLRPLRFKIGERMDDPVSMYLSDAYTIATNLAGLPGISIPAGIVDGLPVGLQIIGGYFQEDKLLNVRTSVSATNRLACKSTGGF